MIFLNVPAAVGAADRALSTLSCFLTALLLIVNTVSDIRSMRIAIRPTRCLALGLLAIRVLSALCRRETPASLILSLILSLLPGLLLKVLSLIAPAMIGGGDGDVVLALGCVLSFDDILNALLWSFLAAGIYGLMLLIRRQSARTEFPFIPFLSVGTAVSCAIRLIVRYCL